MSVLFIQQSHPVYLVNFVAERGEKVSVKDFLSYLRANLSALSFSWREKDGEWRHLAFQITGDSLETSDSHFLVKVTPSAYKGGLLLSCRISPKRGLESPYELLLSAPFEPKAWERQFYPRLPYLVLPPDSPALIRFLAEVNDWTELKELGVFFYPIGILENKTHFFLWGSIDIGKYALLTPNLLPNRIPCMCLRPIKLKEKEALTIELYLKSFPKSRYPLYRDVLRWYIENWEDSDPLTGTILKKTSSIIEFKKRNIRRLPWGNLAGFPGGEPIADENGNLNAWGRYLSEGWKQQKIGSCWYYAWHNWDDTYPTEGEWVGEVGYKNSADKIRNCIKVLLSAGVHPFLYFRQLLAKEGLKEDGPPYKDWVAVNEKGEVPWGYEWTPSLENAKLIGYQKIHCIPADFGNDAFRLWYLEKLKRCIDFYLPAGIAFDMGWAYPNSAVFSRANPNTSNPHAVARLQADVWNWLREKHPEMRIITNEAPGVPSQLFADGILIEGGFAAGKTELDYESAKAIPTTVISYEYPSQYSAFLVPLDKKDRPYLILKYRVSGVVPMENYALYISEGTVGREATVIKLRELEADGKWHTKIVDLRDITDVEKIKTIAIQVQSSEEQAYFDVAYIAFSDSPTLTLPTENTEFSHFPSYIDCRFSRFWQSHPEWLGNPSKDYRVEVKEDYTHFEVRGQGVGMKWEFIAHSGIIAQEYMKVLSLGACIGGDLWYPFPEILSFSAFAMAMPPITDSRRLVVNDERIWVSGWEDEEKLLIAIYNKSEEEVRAVLKLKKDMFVKMRNNIMVILNAYGEPLRESAPNLKEEGLWFEIPSRGAILIYPDMGKR